MTPLYVISAVVASLLLAYLLVALLAPERLS
jgi:K+-transporting ATPase KdpF subunit